MVTFLLNGEERTADAQTNLLAYLREEAGLTSVKNGCARGACGACTVLVDGMGKRACLLELAKVAGKSILTVEGLSPREKEIYAHAFAKAGAVQCGFCTPGMVMSAKALLDKNPQPTEKDVRAAIRGNICRCTGYVKIVDAILLAAKLLAGEETLEATRCAGRVGESLARVDAEAKTLGTALYCDDVNMPDILHVKVLRSDYPRAKVVSIDTAAAAAMPGVAAVLTAADIPGEVYTGYVIPDWPTLVPVGDITRYTGDAIALVAAETAVQAEAALEKIRVQYDVLPAVTDPVKALQENAPPVHPGGNTLVHVYINRGEPETAVEEAAHVVTRTVKLPFTDHAFMEPESTLAYYGKDGRLTVLTASQNVYSDRATVARVLGLAPEQVRVKAMAVGGGFGGKEDVILQHHAALVTWCTGRPAKLTFTRQESLRVHPKRHPMNITLTLAVDAEGNFTALRSRIVADTGAYASMGAGVLRRACTHSCGPYRMPAVEMEGFAVYTNNPPAGAYRGFGVTQSAFALESVVDLMAEKLGMDPWELRRKNALLPGDFMGPGQQAQADTAMVETLEAIKPYYDEARRQGETVGLACAIKNAGMGGGKEDVSRARLQIEQGRVVLYTSAQCLGQGLDTAMIQIIAETTGLDARQISSNGPDTALTPNANATTASRQTLVTGEAVRKAARQLAQALAGQTLGQLEGREFYAEYFAATEKLNDPQIEHPKNHVAYSYATCLAILDEDGWVERIVAAHDVGRAINPQLVEGQIEGGVVMGMGYALTENFVVEDGYVKTDYAHLGLLRATEIPEIIPIIVGKGAPGPAYSAKGIGEISAIPVVPAIAAAYRRRDGNERLALPLMDTPYSRK